MYIFRLYILILYIHVNTRPTYYREPLLTLENNLDKLQLKYTYMNPLRRTF